MTYDIGARTQSYDSPDYKYWMYLVINEYFEGFSEIEAIVQLLLNFGKALGKKAKVLVPMQGSYFSTKKSVIRRDWDDETWKELDRLTSPYLLIIRKRLKAFKPKQDDFIIMRFPEALADPAEYMELLDEIAREINADQDIFRWKKERERIAGKMLGRLFEAIDAKPGVFGFSIDLKKLVTGK